MRLDESIRLAIKLRRYLPLKRPPSISAAYANVRRQKSMCPRIGNGPAGVGLKLFVHSLEKISVRNTLRTEAQTVMATAAITLLRYQEGESCSAIKNAASSSKRCRHTAHAASAGTKQRISILPRRLTYQTTASPSGFPAFRMIAFSGTCHHEPLIGTQ